MRALATACLLCLLPWASARAEPKRGGPQPEDVLPLSELDDPIGVDQDSRTLEQAAGGTAPASRADAAEAARARLRYGPEPAKIAARTGEALTAAPSTREIAHRVTVELVPGLTRVQVEMQFESRAQRPSEIAYRLAVPEHSHLAQLEVCNDAGCRAALPAGEEAERAYAAALLARPASGKPSAPIAHARAVRDARGHAIAVRAAPVRAGQPLTVRLGYAVATRLRGGVLRLVLPARGMDPQVAPAELRVRAPGLIDVRAGGAPATSAATGFDPWSEIALSARAKTGEPVHAAALDAPCPPRGRCALAHVWSGPGAGTPVELVIALDVSPSTEGEARGRLLPAITALLETLPAGSQVRALAFAGRAQPLIAEALDPNRVELAPFARAIAEAELGSATRFEAVWELARGWLLPRARGALRPVIAIVGDGGLTQSAARAFDKARAAGVEVSAINTAEREAQRPLLAGVRRTGGIVIDVGPEAEEAARGRDAAALRDALLALTAPLVARAVTVVSGGKRIELGPLRAGEQLAYEGPVRGALRLQYGARSRVSRAAARELQGAIAGAAGSTGRALAALDARDLNLAGQGWPEQPAKGTCDPRGPARRHSGQNRDDLPLAVAEHPVCKPPAHKTQKPAASAASEPGRGMPADPLLSMLRQRILPVARGCFRRDRAGRADYQRRAVFAFTLAEREVVAASVEGAIPPALRSCLLAAVDSLEVPRFTGIVQVRYPLVTESVPLPEQIELRAETAGDLDRLFGGEAAP